MLNPIFLSLALFCGAVSAWATDVTPPSETTPEPQPVIETPVAQTVSVPSETPPQPEVSVQPLSESVSSNPEPTPVAAPSAQVEEPVVQATNPVPTSDSQPVADPTIVSGVSAEISLPSTSSAESVVKGPQPDEMIDFKYYKHAAGSKTLEQVRVPFFKEPKNINPRQEFAAFESFDFAPSSMLPMALIQLFNPTLCANLPSGNPLKFASRKSVFSLHAPADYRDGKRPLVILGPGSNGVSEFEMWFADLLNKRGYMVFALHSNASRGIPDSSTDNQMKVSIISHYADAQLLESMAEDLPFVDAERIAYFGESYSGVVADLLADETLTHAAFGSPAENGKHGFKAIYASGGLPIFQMAGSKISDSIRFGIFHAINDRYNELEATMSYLRRAGSKDGEFVDNVVMRIYPNGGHSYNHPENQSKKDGITYKHPSAMNLSRRCIYIHAQPEDFVIHAKLNSKLSSPDALMNLVMTKLANIHFSIMTDFEDPKAERRIALSAELTEDLNRHIKGTRISLLDMGSAFREVPKGTETKRSRRDRAQFEHDIIEELAETFQ